MQTEVERPDGRAAPGRAGESLAGELRRLARERAAGERLALVIQGGGMRGVYSMAALAALEDEGLRDAFTHVVGSSAGAINGAYFLAGQSHQGVEIYTDALSGGQLVSRRRFWKVLDVDHVIDEIVKREYRLDLDAMGAARGTLYTVLTDADTASALVVSSRNPSIDTYEALRATSALPGLYNRKVRIGRRHYIDGGVASLVPVDIAFDLGATAALVLFTRAVDYRRPGHGWAFRAALSVLPTTRSGAVRTRLCTTAVGCERTMPPPGTEAPEPLFRTWALRPSSKEALIDRLTDDRHRLGECVRLAKRDMRALLDSPV